MTNCFYCGNQITDDNISEEHIIQNALGGFLKSKSVCCKKCNKLLQENVDDTFIEQFNPLLSQMNNLNRDRETNIPSYNVLFEANGEVFAGRAKGAKVTHSKEYSSKYKCKVPKNNDFTILSIDIKLENKSFKNGITKIATNFAAYNGINREQIDCFCTDNNKIEFYPKLIPFFPLNAFDEYIELEAYRISLYHCLILFSHHNHLFCYVDLFNTYQYYVVLSEHYSGEEIYKPYFQVIEKMDRSSPFDDGDFIDGNLNLSPKDILIYSMQYGVHFDSENPDKFVEEINEKIRLVTNKQNLSKFISGRIGHDYVKFELQQLFKDGKPNPSAYRFYFEIIEGTDDETRLRDAVYKKYTINSDNRYYLYPLKLCDILGQLRGELKEYFYKKTHNLYNYISQITDNVHSVNFINTELH